MGGGKLLVPSDVTLLEEKYSVGRRRLRFFERLGLVGILPMLHLHYTKLDKTDYRRILSHEFGTSATPTEQDKEVVEILKTRQKSIRRRVLSQNYMWAAVDIATLLTWISIRHYDYKAKLIILPFVAYGASFIGRWTGDCMTGRWREYGRDQLLGLLPSKQFYVPAPSENNK